MTVIITEIELFSAILLLICSTETDSKFNQNNIVQKIKGFQRNSTSVQEEELGFQREFELKIEI